MKEGPRQQNGKDEPKTNTTVYITSARKCSESPGTNNMHMSDGYICRTSNRQKKCPVTKSDDFLW
jgi:hypothetical protein